MIAKRPSVVLSTVKRYKLLGAVVFSALCLVGCEAPGSAKPQQVDSQVPPLGVLPDLPEKVTAKPTRKQTPTAPVAPSPVPAPSAPPAVTVTKLRPPRPQPAPRRPAPAPAPAPKDDSEIRIHVPPELRNLL